MSVSPGGATAAAHVGDYAASGVAVVPSLLGAESLGIIGPYLDLLGHNGGFSTESVQVPGSFVIYGDPLVDSIMASLVPFVSAVVGEDVVPTYSYVRAYLRGHELRPHRDRPACEHSLTLHLSSASPGADDWPVWFEDRTGARRSHLLGPGDAALYRGNELLHWREPCPSDWFLQAFLHYVEAGGPAARHALDGRTSLGVQRSGTSRGRG